MRLILAVSAVSRGQADAPNELISGQRHGIALSSMICDYSSLDVNHELGAFMIAAAWAATLRP
jgi:hypothetical protein